MPSPINAIPGQPDLNRKREKAKRLVLENISGLPNWIKAWTPDEMEIYVDANITDLASAKIIISKLAWLCGALRDYMLLKQEKN